MFGWLLLLPTPPLHLLEAQHERCVFILKCLSGSLSCTLCHQTCKMCPHGHVFCVWQLFCTPTQKCAHCGHIFVLGCLLTPSCHFPSTPIAQIYPFGCVFGVSMLPCPALFLRSLLSSTDSYQNLAESCGNQFWSRDNPNLEIYSSEFQLECILELAFRWNAYWNARMEWQQESTGTESGEFFLSS